MGFDNLDGEQNGWWLGCGVVFIIVGVLALCFLILGIR